MGMSTSRENTLNQSNIGWILSYCLLTHQILYIVLILTRQSAHSYNTYINKYMHVAHGQLVK